MVVVRFVPEAVWAAAVKLITLPSCIDVGKDGVRVTLPAQSGGPGLLPPQPVIDRRAIIGKNSQRLLVRDLPMHSSLFIVHQTPATARVVAHSSQPDHSKDLENL